MNPLVRIREFEPAKKAWTFLDEFKTFALKGNVIDLAIGVHHRCGIQHHRHRWHKGACCHR